MRFATLQTVVLGCVLLLTQCGLAQEKNIARSESQAQKWAILIGVDQYVAASELLYAGRDMNALRQRLIAAGFPEDHVFILTTEAGQRKAAELPFKSNIDVQLDLLFGQLADDGKSLIKPGRIAKGDLVVVAFSGHGVHFPQEGSFICPTDARLDRPNSMVSVDVLFQRMIVSQAGTKLMIVDACRNDPFERTGRAPGDPNNNRNFVGSFSKLPQGLLLLSSCAPGQKSREDDDFRHGVFMKFLLDGLEGLADRPQAPDSPHSRGNEDGRVSLNELFAFASNSTTAYVAQRYKAEQTPTLRQAGDEKITDFEFGEYSRKLPFASFFAIREDNASGPPAVGAELSLLYFPAADAPPRFLSKTKVDEQGRAELTVLLGDAERSKGRFSVVVSYKQNETKTDLPGFLDHRNWTIYADRGSPLAERVEQLNKAGKYAETLTLVWDNWNQIDAQVRRAFNEAGEKAPQWWLVESAKLGDRVESPTDQVWLWTAQLLATHKAGLKVETQVAAKKALNAIRNEIDPLLAIEEGIQLALAAESIKDTDLAMKALEQVELALEAIPKAGSGRNGASTWLIHHPFFRIETCARIAGMAKRLKQPDLETKYATVAMSLNDQGVLGHIFAASVIHIDAGEIEKGFRLLQGKDESQYFRLMSGSSGAFFQVQNQWQAQYLSMQNLTQSTYFELPTQCWVAVAAATYQRQDDYQTAIRKIHGGVANLQPMFQQHMIDRCYMAIVKADSLMGKLDASSKRALQIKDPYLKADSMLTLGIEQAKRGEIEAALKTLQALQAAGTGSRSLVAYRIVSAQGLSSERNLFLIAEEARKDTDHSQAAARLAGLGSWSSLKAKP